MTAKEYLSQARTLDMRIKSKLQQIESLNELATSCTVVYSDMPRNPNHGGSKVETAVIKIIEVEESLKRDVDNLVELKKEIMATIHAVSDVERPAGEAVSVLPLVGEDCGGDALQHSAYIPDARYGAFLCCRHHESK